MSDRSYPDTVNVHVDGQQYRGCGAPIAFFSQVGESGQPNYPEAPHLLIPEARAQFERNQLAGGGDQRHARRRRAIST